MCVCLGVALVHTFFFFLNDMKVLFIILLFISTTRSWATDVWQYLLTNSQGIDLYFAPSTLETHPNQIRRIWTKMVLPTQNQTIREIKILEEVDCQNNKIRILTMTDYVNYHVVDSEYTPHADWNNVVPNTVNEAKYTVICRL